MPNSFKINLAKATELVLAFLKQKDLLKFATDVSIGGVIARDSILGKDVTYYGSMSWFCWKASPPFLAFEDGEYDPDKVTPATQPKKNKMMRSNTNLVYDRGVSSQEVEDFIKTSVTQINQDQEIDKSDVLISLGGIPTDSTGNPFNKFPFGFFENRGIADMEEFLSQTGLTHVKYLYGFDDSDDSHKKTNRIRIILVGIKSDGSTITASIKTGAILMQKSWPPPPNS